MSGSWSSWALLGFGVPAAIKGPQKHISISFVWGYPYLIGLLYKGFIWDIPILLFALNPKP